MTDLSNPTAATLSAARIAFIQSGWHESIVDNGRKSFMQEIEQLASARVSLFKVPGAFEIPLHAKKLAQSGQFDAIVACGFVVNGGIYRHEFVTEAVINGLMAVQLDTGVPVFSVVLTPIHYHEHQDHQRFFEEHFLVKGAEAARACVATLKSLQELQLTLAA